LRERLDYGDAGSPNQSAAERENNRAANRLGKLARSFDEAGLLSFDSYDFKGNLLEKTRQVVSDAAILGVFNGPPPAWNVEAFRVDWTTPAAVSLDAGGYTSSVSYDAIGRAKLMTYPEDVENKRRKLRPFYNRAGALERVALERVGPGGGVIYDLVGNIEHLKHLANGAGGFNRDFALVPGNNRLHTLTTGAAVFGYEYDVNGNLTQETTSRHFEWDYADRMRVYRTQTNASEPSVHVHYLYDAGGQRVKKLVRKQGGQVEVTVYIDGAFEYQRIVRGGVIEENNTLHLMDDQSRIALVRVGNPFAGDTTPAVKYHQWHRRFPQRTQHRHAICRPEPDLCLTCVPPGPHARVCQQQRGPAGYHGQVPQLGRWWPGDVGANQGPGGKCAWSSTHR